MRIGRELPAAITQVAINLDRIHRSAVQLAVAAVQHDVTLPVAANHVVLPLGTQHTRFGHQQDHRRPWAASDDD